jgi:hypothetical protein
MLVQMAFQGSYGSRRTASRIFTLASGSHARMVFAAHKPEGPIDSQWSDQTGTRTSKRTSTHYEIVKHLELAVDLSTGFISHKAEKTATRHKEIDKQPIFA